MHAIAQGASERNISVVVDGKDATRALRAVHSGFYLSPHTISIGLIGPGAVGRVLLEQIAAESARLRDDFKLDLRLRGIMTSKKMLLAEQGIAVDGWKAALEAQHHAGRHRQFVEHLHVDHLPHTVIIDCTADEAWREHYAEWLAAGIHVVTPNKKANSGPLAYYDSLQGGAPLGGSSLSLRSHRGRRAAGHPDAARSARDRRQDLERRGHLLGHAGQPVGSARRKLQARRKILQKQLAMLLGKLPKRH